MAFEIFKKAKKAKAKNFDVVFPVRMSKSMHKELKKIAYNSEMTISEVVRVSVKNLIESQKKLLT